MNKNRHEREEAEVRELIENWAKAVRAKDRAAILAHHAADIVMFDVPPPFVSKGISAYEKTWDLFFSMQPEPITFEIKQLDIVAGADVAFAVTHMQCVELGKDGERLALHFRLTIGLRKIDGHWQVLHEHHSIPAL